MQPIQDIGDAVLLPIAMPRKAPQQGRTQAPLPRPSPDAGSERLERVEERLVAHVTPHRAGHLRVRRKVVEEREQIEVALRHDELDLERRSVDRPLEPNEEPISSRGDTTVLLVIEERLDVRKVPWVVEEIHLRRRLVTH